LNCQQQKVNKHVPEFHSMDFKRRFVANAPAALGGAHAYADAHGAADTASAGASFAAEVPCGASLVYADAYAAYAAYAAEPPHEDAAADGRYPRGGPHAYAAYAAEPSHEDAAADGRYPGGGPHAYAAYAAEPPHEDAAADGRVHAAFAPAA
jgi:hypothetical protein